MKKRLFKCLLMHFLALTLIIPFIILPAHADTVTLAWDPSDGATGYKIYWGTSSRTYEHVIDVGKVLIYTVGLPEGSTYYFAATAYDGTSIESDYSDEVSYCADWLVKNVRLLAALGSRPASAVLVWDTVAGATGYRIDYGLAADAMTQSVTYTTSQGTLTGLRNSTTYYAKVTAISAAGDMGTSAAISFRTLTITGLRVQ